MIGALRVHFDSQLYLQRLVEPPEVRHERLFLVSVGGLIVNLLGIFAFQHGHGHSHGGGGGKSLGLTTSPEVIKLFMLNSTEHEISTSHKN